MLIKARPIVHSQEKKKNKDLFLKTQILEPSVESASEMCIFLNDCSQGVRACGRLGIIVTSNVYGRELVLCTQCPPTNREEGSVVDKSVLR